MNIRGIHVDGFGGLSDLSIKDLGPGLTVFFGPNEAGKSTLLDFIRGVLFGYPRSRSHHLPLRGGRHGGSLAISDVQDRHYVFERYVGSKAPVLRTEDGIVLGDDDLHRLLGNADDALFRSVFAVGLHELANFDTLEREEVRDMVFSAGVLGAGRSATLAMRSIESQRTTLVRPRQQEAVAHKLRTRLSEVEAALRSARSESRAFPQAFASLEQLRAEVRLAQAASDANHHRSAELTRLIDRWPSWLRREQAKTALLELGSMSEQSQLLLDNSDHASLLVKALSGYSEQHRRRGELESQLAGINKTLERCLADATLRIDGLVAIKPEDETRASANSQNYADRRVALQVCEAEVLRIEVELDSARHNAMTERERCATRAQSELELAEQQAKRLRRLVGTRDQFENDMEAWRRECALEHRLHHGDRNDTSPKKLVVSVVLGVVGLILVGIGWTHHSAALMAAGLVGVASATLLAGRIHNKSTAAPVLDWHKADDLDRVNDEIALVAPDFGLGQRPMNAEIDTVLESIETESRRALQLSALEREQDKVELRLRDAVLRSQLALQELQETEVDLRAQADELGLDPNRSFNRLPQHVSAIRTAHDLLGAKRRVEHELIQVGAQVDSYQRAVVELAEKTGLVKEVDTDDIGATVAVIDRCLQLALDNKGTRTELEHTMRLADEDLAGSIGDGEDAIRFLDQLATGEVLAWQAERHELGTRLSATADAYELALGKLKDGERVIEHLLHSDEIAALEVERSTLESALEQALSAWTTLSVAKALLSETLARYEKERQPAVIARAAELFSKVTQGRYNQLVAREESEGAHRHRIDAINASSGRVDSADLSTGTAEQLYLCLRLAFASTFAERSVSLPLVLDDVLVNFDPGRARAVAEAIAATANEHQVFAFTCHPHVVEDFRSSTPDVRVVELERVDYV